MICGSVTAIYGGLQALAQIDIKRILAYSITSHMSTIAIILGLCIFCGMCADICPANTITVTREFELAAVELEDLKEEIVHEVSKCAICGKPFETIAQVKYVRDSQLITEKYVYVCPDCRSKRAAKLFAMKPGEIS